MTGDAADASITMPRMRAVVAVARTNSFGSAARVLGTSQSSVSRSVAVIEHALGVALFDRSTRRVTLTDAGREFVDRSEIVLADMRAAIDAVRPSPVTAGARQVTVACLMSIAPTILAPAVGRMSGGPWSRVRVLELLQDSIELEVRNGTADVGVGDLRGLPADLRSRPLWSEDAMVCVPDDHRLARRRRLLVRDLADEELIAFPREARLRVVIDRALANAGQLRSPRYVVQQYDTAFALVAARCGICVVPAGATLHLPRGLTAVALNEPPAHRSVGAIWRPSAPPSSAVDALLDALVAEASALQHPRIHV